MSRIDFVHFTSYHKRYNTLLIHIYIGRCPHDMPVSHNGNDIRYLLYFFQTVRNIDAGNPPPFQFLCLGKQNLAFFIRQCGSRFIQKKHLHIIVHGSRNDKQLFLGNTDFLYLCLRLHIQPEIFDNLLRFLIHLVIIDESSSHRVFVHEKILSHTQFFQHIQILGNHNDSLALGIQYRLELTRLTCQLNRPGESIVGIYACQHFHQCGFPCTVSSYVLTHQCVYRSPFYS